MHADILNGLESLRTLERGMHWAASLKPPARLLKVVTQDEFTHDVVFQVLPDLFVLFDTT
jgi:hypothetical protein